jgi:hypothetical protein
MYLQAFLLGLAAIRLGVLGRRGLAHLGDLVLFSLFPTVIASSDELDTDMTIRWLIVVQFDVFRVTYPLVGVVSVAGEAFAVFDLQMLSLFGCQL